MQYSELSKPTYKLQEMENQRHHFYFQIKTEENLSLSQLEEYLKEQYDTIMSKTWETNEQLRKELKKYFHGYDVRKAMKNYDFDKQRVINPNIIPISQSQLENMSSEGCWTLREIDKINDDNEEINRSLRGIRFAYKVERFKRKQKIKDNILDKIEKELIKGKLSQVNQGVQAYVGLDENDDKDLGESDSNFNIHLDADVDATAEFKSPLDVRMEEFQKQIREGVPRKRLEDELKDNGIL